MPIMADVRNYTSTLNDPASRRLGTFSYLPPMDRDRILAQIRYIVSKRWIPAVEHSEPENAKASYWYMWKLPMFGVTDVAAIMAELDACHQANPGHHVRLIGYDTPAQSQGASMVVYR